MIKIGIDVGSTTVKLVAIDENDNLLLEIVGLGRCTTDMLKNSLGVSKRDNFIIPERAVIRNWR